MSGLRNCSPEVLYNIGKLCPKTGVEQYSALVGS